MQQAVTTYTRTPSRYPRCLEPWEFSMDEEEPDNISGKYSRGDGRGQEQESLWGAQTQS